MQRFTRALCGALTDKRCGFAGITVSCNVAGAGFESGLRQQFFLFKTVVHFLLTENRTLFCFAPFPIFHIVNLQFASCVVIVCELLLSYFILDIFPFISSHPMPTCQQRLLYKIYKQRRSCYSSDW